MEDVLLVPIEEEEEEIDETLLRVQQYRIKPVTEKVEKGAATLTLLLRR